MKLKKYKSQQSEDLNTKLRSYTALTGAFLLGSVAHGQIIYTDINPDSSIVRSSFDIDMDHDGMVDFVIQHWTSYYNDFGAEFKAGANPSNQAMASHYNFFFGTNDYVLPLPAGNPIGPGGPFYDFNGRWSLRLSRHWIQRSYLDPGVVTTHEFKTGFFLDTAAYIGVEFNSNGNKYYGWIECEIDSMVDAVVVKGYAYESTPNMYIIAGSGRTIGIDEHESSIGMASSFYPNPVSNGKTFITVDAKQFADLKLEILNGMGQVLLSENRKLNSGKNIIELDVSSLTSGTYFVKLTEGDQNIFRRILVSK